MTSNRPCSAGVGSPCNRDSRLSRSSMSRRYSAVSWSQSFMASTSPAGRRTWQPGIWQRVCFPNVHRPRDDFFQVRENVAVIVIELRQDPKSRPKTPAVGAAEAFFRLPTALRYPEQHRLRCPNTGRCTPARCGPAAAALRRDSGSAGGRASLSRAAATACRTRWDRNRSSWPGNSLSGRNGVSIGAVIRALDLGTGGRLGSVPHDRSRSRRRRGLFCEFDAAGPLGLVLYNQGPCDGMAAVHGVADLHSDQVAALGLAVDGLVDHRQLSGAVLDAEPNPDAADLLQPTNRFRSNQYSLVPGFRRQIPGSAGNQRHLRSLHRVAEPTASTQPRRSRFLTKARRAG